MPPKELLKRVEIYLRKTGEAPAVFSKRVTGDPAMVLKMRRGRELRFKLAEKVLKAISQ